MEQVCWVLQYFALLGGFICAISHQQLGMCRSRQDLGVGFCPMSIGSVLLEIWLLEGLKGPKFGMLPRPGNLAFLDQTATDGSQKCPTLALWCLVAVKLPCDSLGGCQQEWSRFWEVLGFFHQLFRFSGVSKVDDHVAALETRILVCLGPQNSKHRQRYGRYSVCHWQPFKLSNTISLVAPASGCREHAFTPGLPKMTRGSTLGVGLTPVRRGGDHSPGAHCAGPRWLTELTLP